jgi:hypothetical protein
MPITIEFIPLTRTGHARHAARDWNLRGLARWWRLTRADTDLVAASRAFFDDVVHSGGTFHLYARSWQIEQLGLWEQFDHVLDHVARWEDARYLTNRGAAEACGSGP